MTDKARVLNGGGGGVSTVVGGAKGSQPTEVVDSWKRAAQMNMKALELQVHDNNYSKSLSIILATKITSFSALSGTPTPTMPEAKPQKCLSLRSRTGRIKSSFVPWKPSLPTTC